jgi:hypothetical protein
MTEVMKTMSVKRVNLAVGTVAVAALGLLGIAYQAVGSGSARAAPPDKPDSELEALRKENELLKLNLQIVLEKVRTQEAQLKAHDSAWRPHRVNINQLGGANTDLLIDTTNLIYTEIPNPPDVSVPTGEAETALKALREAKDKEGRRKAADALENALKKFKEQVK